MPLLSAVGGAASLRAQGALAPIGTILSEQSRTAFNIEGAGARAMGLGGAFIALADDATAVSFNPAGLAQMVRPELSFVGQGINRSVAFQDAQTVAGSRVLLVDDSLISNSRADPLLIAGTVPLRVDGKTLALQLSAQRLIPLGEGDHRSMLERPLDGSAPSQLFQNLDQSGQIDVYSFAAAFELSQRVLVGASVNAWQGSWYLDSDTRNTTSGTTTYITFDQWSRLEGWNYNLGILWRWPTWSLGLVRRTAFHADFTYSAAYTSSAVQAPVTSAATTSGLHWPATTGLGLVLRPAEQWVAAVDVVQTPWSQTKFMSSRPSLDGLDFFTASRTVRTQDATQLHAGVERLFLTASGSVIPLRMGFSREPQPVTDRTTGEQRVILGLSLGSGIKRGPYTFDAAYRYGWGHRQASQFLDPQQILANTQVTTVGRESITEHRLEVSFIVQFSRAPVQDLLHYLFVGD